MRITRPFARRYALRHPLVHVAGYGELERGGRISWPGPSWSASDAGPSYKGMDPSDPATYVRPWNPQPGMIAYLNFDGAMGQGRTPTQVQRGSQRRGARGSR